MVPRISTQRRLICIIIVLLLSTSACDSKSAIVGRWKLTEGRSTGAPEILEFFADGTVTAASLLLSYSGDYTLVDDDTIRIDFGGIFGLTGPRVYDFSLSGDELSLSGTGIRGKYERSN